MVFVCLFVLFCFCHECPDCLPACPTAAPADTTATEILNPDSGLFNYSYCYCGALRKRERGREREREMEEERGSWGKGGRVRNREKRGGGYWCFLRKAALQMEYVCVPSGSIDSSLTVVLLRCLSLPLASLSLPLPLLSASHCSAWSASSPSHLLILSPSFPLALSVVVLYLLHVRISLSLSPPPSSSLTLTLSLSLSLSLSLWHNPFPPSPRALITGRALTLESFKTQGRAAMLILRSWKLIQGHFISADLEYVITPFS